MDLEFVKIENGKEFLVLDEYVYENNTYVIMVNVIDKFDFLVRKVINNDLIGLENERELQNVLFSYFKTKKNF